MRVALAFILLAACGGPSAQQAIESPSATETPRRNRAEAPPASPSDQDRSRVNQQFEDMETTQNAYRQAEQGSAAPPPPPPRPPGTPPPKKAPVEQAPK